MAIKVTNKMAFWLSYTTTHNTVQRLQLPVNPAEFEVSNETGHTDISITNLGEVTVMGNKKLMTLSFSSFFPRDYDRSYCEYSAIPKPYEAVKWLEAVMNSKRPVQLTVTHTNINIPVTIRSFKYTEKGGEVGDVYFDIELKEYRAPKVKIYDPNKKTPGSGTRPTPSHFPVKYIVKKGDTLVGIAKKFYGDGSKWRIIYDYNRKTIGSNPNRLYVGMVLIIPDPNTKSSNNHTSSGGYIWYTIRSGDTLSEIAAAYSNCSLDDIYRLNPNIKPNALRVGQKIKLPKDAKRMYDPKRLSGSGGNSGKMAPAPKPAEKEYTIGGTKVTKKQWDKYRETKRKQIERFDDTSTVSKGSPPKGVLV